MSTLPDIADIDERFSAQSRSSNTPEVLRCFFFNPKGDGHEKVTDW